MTEENKSIGNFPNLRFPEFEKEWEFAILGKCAYSFEYGMNASAIKFDGENRYIRITDIDESTSKYKPEFPVSPNGQLIDKYLVSENDILFARTGASTGKSYLYHKDDGKLYFAGFLIRAKIKEEFNSYFVFTQTKTIQYYKWVKLMSMRSGQPGINSQEYASYSFNIPSKNEQDKIASFLLLLDERISTQKKIIEQLETLIKANREKLFSQKLRFKDDQGNYFSDWDLIELKNVCFIIGGGTPDTQKFEFWNGNIQWFTPTEIKSNSVFKSERTISELGLKNSSAKILPQGSILLTTRATIGEVAIAQEECTTNQGFQSLIVKENCNNIFLFHWIKENKFELIKRANGSTFPEISKSEIELIKISLPCLNEQNKIANFLSSIQEKIETEKEILEKLELQKKFLLANLFI